MMLKNHQRTEQDGIKFYNAIQNSKQFKTCELLISGISLNIFRPWLTVSNGNQRNKNHEYMETTDIRNQEEKDNSTQK